MDFQLILFIAAFIAGPILIFILNKKELSGNKEKIFSELKNILTRYENNERIEIGADENAPAYNFAMLYHMMTDNKVLNLTVMSIVGIGMIVALVIYFDIFWVKIIIPFFLIIIIVNIITTALKKHDYINKIILNENTITICFVKKELPNQIYDLNDISIKYKIKTTSDSGPGYKTFSFFIYFQKQKMKVFYEILPLRYKPSSGVPKHLEYFIAFVMFLNFKKNNNLDIIPNLTEETIRNYQKDLL